MDILYYSNYCKYSKNVLKYIVSNGLIEKINAICIDKHRIDKTTGQQMIILENGNSVILPPNIHSVPSILLKTNFNVICGENEIIKYLAPTTNIITEPEGFLVSSNNAFSNDNYMNYTE